MTNIPDNIRLKELAIIANSNKPFFDDFINFLESENYNNLYKFIIEKDSSKAENFLLKYLERKLPKDLNLYHNKIVLTIPSVATANDPGLRLMVTSSGKKISLG